MARLVLVGLPGVGKSTVAERLAQLWTCPWVDTDVEIESTQGMAPADILRERGEAVFRDVELTVLKGVLSQDVIVSTGGGVVTTSEARDLLRNAPTLWLDCDDATILERVATGDRPLLGSNAAEAITALRTAREPWYADVARIKIDATGDLDDVVARVAQAATAVAR